MSGELEAPRTVTELSTLLIPVKGRQLMVPNVAVAEIIHYVEPYAMEDVPNWLLGTIDWRNQVLPLISFEAINDEPFAARAGPRRVAVFNGLSANDRLPFYAMLSQGAPRLMRVEPEDIVRDTEHSLGPAEAMVVSVHGELAVIPNLEFIESQVLTLL